MTETKLRSEQSASSAKQSELINFALLLLANFYPGPQHRCWLCLVRQFLRANLSPVVRSWGTFLQAATIESGALQSLQYMCLRLESVDWRLECQNK